MSRYRKFTTICFAAVLALGLAACGSGDDTAAVDPTPPVVEPTPYETASAAIAAADTAEAAQAAYDAVKDDVTAAQGGMLQAAVDARVAALATMASAADQKMALMTAAGNVDTSGLATAADIAAANNAIAALKAALAAATDVSDADKAMYQGQVTAAETAVATAQSALDHAAQTMALSAAHEALQALDLSGLTTDEAIDAAEAAIAALRTALEDATELSAAEKAAATTELATANRVVMAAQGRVDTQGQKMVLSDAVDALGLIDLDDLMTQAQIDAAEEAIIALDLALKAATGLTDAEKLDATVDVTLAKRRVASAQDSLDDNIDTQKMALTKAGKALADLDTSEDGLSDQEKIDAADEAVKALKAALEAATHLSDAEKAMYQTQLNTATETVRMAQTGMDRDGRMMAQREALSDTSETLQAALAALAGQTPTQAQLDAANEARTALNEAIMAAEDLTDAEKAPYQREATNAAAPIQTAQNALDLVEDDDNDAEQRAMRLTASRMFGAIGRAPLNPAAEDIETTAATDGQRTAAYTGTNDADIRVRFDSNPAMTALTDTNQVLKATKTSVADNHDWEGKEYAASGTGVVGTYVARVYSDIADPTPGKKFGSAAAVPNPNTGQFEYQLTDGALPSASFEAENVAFTGVTRTAGTEAFKLPDPNPSGADIINIPGSYHGVSGTYSCTPADAAVGCSAAVAARGFTVSAGDTWTFKPTDANARVMEMADSEYASYGWWLHKSADGRTWTASAFTDRKGDDTVEIADLTAGTATYVGGAAGKYSLFSLTGGTNDAGHFTARATLEADFDEDMVSGTIDQFMGADGMSRDWSVELMESGLSDGGAIQASDGEAVTAENSLKQTVWTIGETEARAAGQWSGSLEEEGTDGVPKVATGTFSARHANTGLMVGAFGANKQ